MFRYRHYGGKKHRREIGVSHPLAIVAVIVCLGYVDEDELDEVA